MCEKERGIYLIAFKENEPTYKYKKKFILNWHNQLEIGDASLYIMKNKESRN